LDGSFGKRNCLLLFAAVSLHCCAATRPVATVPPAQTIPVQRIDIGMSAERVGGILGPPAGLVGVKTFPDGGMEVRSYVVNQFNLLDDTASKKEYYLYFWNGRLVRWDHPDEWQVEVDRIHDSLKRR